MQKVGVDIKSVVDYVPAWFTQVGDACNGSYKYQLYPVQKSNQNTNNMLKTSIYAIIHNDTDISLLPTHSLYYIVRWVDSIVAGEPYY